MIIERKSEKSASEKSYLQYFVFQVNYCNTKIHLFSQKNRTEMDEYVLFLSVHLIQQISHQNELLFSHLVTSNSLHPIDCNTPGFPVLHYLLDLLKHMSIEPVMPFNHLGICGPLLFLSSIFPSIRVFSNELGLHIRWPMYWSFKSVLPMNIQD